jgi:hypothetical protein
MKNSTYTRWSHTVSTVKKSTAKAAGLCTEELSPGRAAPNRWAESFGTEDLLDRGGRDHHADALQLADDPLIAPPRILPGKPHNQCADVCWDRWSTGWSRIGPAPGDQQPVPPEERRRRDDKHRPVDGGNSRLAADRNTRREARYFIKIELTHPTPLPAYEFDESGEFEVFVHAFDPSSGSLLPSNWKVQISDAGRGMAH